jgi:hypothetical protein
MEGLPDGGRLSGSAVAVDKRGTISQKEGIESINQKQNISPLLGLLFIFLPNYLSLLYPGSF